MSNLSLDLGFAALLGDCKKKGLLKSEKGTSFNNKSVKRNIAVVASRTFKPTALILLKHTYVCQCGSCYDAPNTTLLRELKNAKGERKLEQNILPSDLKELPRVIEEMSYDVDVCFECFAGEDLEHVIKNQKSGILPELENLL